MDANHRFGGVTELFYMPITSARVLRGFPSGIRLSSEAGVPRSFPIHFTFPCHPLPNHTIDRVTCFMFLAEGQVSLCPFYFLCVVPTCFKTRSCVSPDGLLTYSVAQAGLKTLILPQPSAGITGSTPIYLAPLN